MNENDRDIPVSHEIEAAVALSLMFPSMSSPGCLDIIEAIIADKVPYVKFIGEITSNGQKGLLEDDYTQQNVSVADESSVTQTAITWEQQAKRIGIAEFMGTPLTELSEHKQEVFWEFIRKKLKD